MHKGPMHQGKTARWRREGAGLPSTGCETACRGRGFIPVQLGLMAEVEYFGRHKGGWIRDGVILSFAAS